MKAWLLLSFILLLSLVGAAQGLPSNFEYKRETGQKTGVPIFTLSVSTASLVYDATKGNGFEALMADVQPERGKYGLLFMNAKPRQALLFGRSRSCSMRIAGRAVPVKVLKAVPAKRLSRLVVEAMLLTVDRGVFDRLVTADDVFVKCGGVSYSLDRDNIDALHWFGAEVSRDLQRRNAKPQ